MEVKTLNRLRNFMRLEVDVKCMQTNLVSLASPISGILLFFQIWPNFPFRPWAHELHTVHWVKKWNWLKKFI